MHNLAQVKLTGATPVERKIIELPTFTPQSSLKERIQLVKYRTGDRALWAMFDYWLSCLERDGKLNDIQLMQLSRWESGR